MADWVETDFHRRRYHIAQSESKELDNASRIEVLVRVDGQTLANLQVREPGIAAVVSRPDDPDGFDLEIVEPGGKRFVDMRSPGDAVSDGHMQEWQQMALFGGE